MKPKREFLFLVLQISSPFAAPLIETINHLKLSNVVDYIPFLKKFNSTKCSELNGELLLNSLTEKTELYNNSNCYH